VTLLFCTEPAAADWITNSDLDWSDLVTLGPTGFPAYARLRYLPDPVRPDMSENDAEFEEWRDGQLPWLFQVLAEHTTTPDHCLFLVWDGFGHWDSPPEEAVPADWTPEAVPGLAPPFEHPDGGPKVELPARAYWLFRGPLAEVGAWAQADGWPGRVRLDDETPAFAWPADRAWCFTSDVDPHWAGIGGTPELIERLIADPRLDVVPTDHDESPPAYR
jgi:hypothetical protein